MNDNKTMLRFRESFRGYNKDDVNAYIEQVNMKFSRKESELRAQIVELQSRSCPVGAPAPQEDVEALKAEIARLSDENRTLKAELDAARQADADTESADKSKLYDSMSSQVGNILIMANDNAEKILADAKAEADRIRSEAKIEAEATKREAAETVNAKLSALDDKLRHVSDNCLSAYEAILADAKVRFGEISDTMKARSKELLIAADVKTRELEKQITEDYSTTDNR